ncbi:DUF177 domain-containing protein [Chloroflexota bacterium]
MEINVAQLLKENIGSTRSYEVSGEVDILGDGGESTVSGEVSLMRTDRSILVRGKLSTGADITCCRCLVPLSWPLELRIEDEYYPTVDVVSGAPVSVPDEPGCFTIDKKHMIDLTEAVRQYALLVLPMKPLCRRDCAGLCPECGGNLNLGPCGCPPRPVDPRWVVLTEIANEQKGTE